MKKILISLLILLLFILNFIGITKGIQLFGLDILSIEQIKEKNANLDTKIGQATTLASTDYPKVLSEMEVNLKKLEEEKKNYEDMVTISTDDQVQLANQYQKYEVEYLWTIIGNHATKEGVVIKIDIVAASGENNYNLNFTVTGSYIGITEFISDIENDSALGFKIENFLMKPGASTQDLQATFICKDIVIKDINKSTATSNRNVTNDSTQKQETNTAEGTAQNTTDNSNDVNTDTTGNTTNNTSATGNNTTNQSAVDLNNN
ncbi:MAG: hypothetical protein IJJ82_04440 [Clostridia bacterium]|nr:hypothetical protein [Clostridia bacterium]